MDFEQLYGTRAGNEGLFKACLRRSAQPNSSAFNLNSFHGNNSVLSAATIGIDGFGATGAITLEMAIPLVLGANIGTCITAFLSSFEQTKRKACCCAAYM